MRVHACVCLYVHEGLALVVIVCVCLRPFVVIRVCLCWFVVVLRFVGMCL